MNIRLLLWGVLLQVFGSAVQACQLRITATSTDVTYPSAFETVATVLVSLRNDGPTDCVGPVFNGPGLLLNVTWEPGGNAQALLASAHPFRFTSVTDFGGRGRCGGAGAQLTAQGICTWSVLRPAETVVMRAELRAPQMVPRPVCFGGVVYGDGQQGIFLVAQPILASFSSCPSASADGGSAAGGATGATTTGPAAGRQFPERERALPNRAIR